MIPNAQTVIERLVKGGIRVTFELCSDGREWLCSLAIEGKTNVASTGTDMPSALLYALLELGVALALRTQEPEDS